MTDLAGALQTALFTRLSAAVTLSDVFQHVPPGRMPPVTIIGEDMIDQAGAKGDQFERHEVDIVTVVAGPGRKPLLALQEQVRAALHDIDLPAQPGVLLSAPALLSTTMMLLDDGVTYYGTQRFVIFAQPA